MQGPRDHRGLSNRSFFCFGCLNIYSTKASTGLQVSLGPDGRSRSFHPKEIHNFGVVLSSAFCVKLLFLGSANSPPASLSSLLLPVRIHLVLVTIQASHSALGDTSAKAFITNGLTLINRTHVHFRETGALIK